MLKAFRICKWFFCCCFQWNPDQFQEDVEFYHVEIEQEATCVFPVAANIPMKYRCLSYIRAKDGEFFGYVQ